MNAIRKIPWPNILGEGLIIVVSILLAFWIQAWWEGRQDRIAERGLLAQLHAESVINRGLLTAYRQHHQDIVDAGIRLLELTGPDVSLTSEEALLIRRDLGSFSDWWTVQPSDGVISSIIQSGQLGLIESDELRSELATWRSLLEDLSDNEQTVVRLSEGALGEYWYANAPYRTVFLDEEIGASKFPLNLESILRDQRFESLVHNKLQSEYTILKLYDSMKASTEKLIQLSAQDE